MKSNYSGLGLATVLLLSACAPRPPEVSTALPSTEGEKESKLMPTQSAEKITSWDVSGALAAKTAQKGWSASLSWQQQGLNQYKIRLLGPLGGGTVIIEKKGSTIYFQDGNKSLKSKNADELLEHQTGVRLPVHNLYYWARGLAAPGATSNKTYDKNHHLVHFNQAGYSISYLDFMQVNQINLPRKMTLQGHGLSMKLVIKHWSF